MRTPLFVPSVPLAMSCTFCMNVPISLDSISKAFTTFRFGASGGNLGIKFKPRLRQQMPQEWVAQYQDLRLRRFQYENELQT